MRHAFLLGAAVSSLIPTAAWADAAEAPGNSPGDVPVIIVTASPIAHNQDDTPAITAHVDSEDILRTGGSNLADALSNVPGIAGTGFAAGASRPIIRGMDATRVKILENGTSSSDVSDIGPDHGVPIDPLAARSIEVVRGAGTLRYGSQAIGGVVNAINNRVPMALSDKPFSGELTGSYDTVSNTWQGSALADVSVGNLAIHADGFDRDADDYDTPLGKLDNSFFRGHGEALGGSYFFGDDSHVGAAVTQYNAKYGIPNEESYLDMKQTKVMTRSEFGLGSGLLKTLKLDGSYSDYQHSEIEDGEIATTFKNNEYDGHAELLTNAFGPIEGAALGMEYSHRKFSAVGEDSSYLFPTLTETVAGYLFVDAQPVEKLHLEASGRVEHVDVQGTPISDMHTKASYTPVSGALGLLYEVSPVVKLGLTASTTGRAPVMTELFARGGHDGPGTFEVGDPDLTIERANSLEGSLRIHSGAFHFDGSIYSSWFHHYIYGDLTGRLCDDDGTCAVDGDGDLKELFYRQQGAHFRGLEGEASLDLIDTTAGTLQANVLADYTRATLDDGSNVPRIPPYRIGGGVNWQGDQLDGGVKLTYAGKQDKFGAYDTATASYYSLDAHIAWRPFENNPNIEFAIVGQNLTNDVQRDAAALNKDEVVMPGRNVRFVVKIATF